MALNVRCGVVFCFLIASLKAAPMDKEADFVDEQGKALKYLKGTKRDDIDLGKAEREAGKAVLKLLDAKIGSKVKQAASEVTDFLNGAIGKHAQARTEKLRSDKEKEISLLHIGAEAALKEKLKEKRKKKDDSFLIHFKVPYVVTPVKKKPRKKYHGHHHHHHHHHHNPHHHDKHQPKKFHPYKPPPNPPAHRPVVHPAPSPYGQRQPQQQGVAGQQPSYNAAIDLNYNGNAWTYSLSNETAASAGVVPCQGSCTEACTNQCSLGQGCCCCPEASIAPVQMEAPAPQYLQFPPATPAAPVAAPASPVASCPPACGRNCFSYCPQSCCGQMGKRTEVAGDEGSASEAAVTEEPEDSEDSDAADSKVDQDNKGDEQTKVDKNHGNDESGDSEAVNDSESKKKTEETSDDI